MPLSHRPTAALVGNPNTGKTTLFNALSGLRQRVGNYPGVTVETKKGQMTCAGQTFDLIDLPGTYSLAPRSPDEMVAVDVILGHQKGESRPDVVVSIVDASNLDRNLYLTTQALELGVPVVVALNMIDVAEGQGIRIDADRLAVSSASRWCRSRPTRARAWTTCARPWPPPPLERQARPGTDVSRGVRAGSRVAAPGRGSGHAEPFWCAGCCWTWAATPSSVSWIDSAPAVGRQVQAARQRLVAAGCPVPAVEARTRYGWIREATAGCVQRPDAARRHLDRPHRPRADAQGCGAR